MRAAIRTCVAAAAALWCAAAVAQTVFQSNAALVVLPLTVTDHSGAYVPGLAASDFQIFEDGKLQRIFSFEARDVPVTAGLVIDNSGSMSPNRAEVLAAARDFLDASNPQDQIFVVNFNEHAELGLPPDTAFTHDETMLEAAVERGPNRGMTALYDATALALRQVVRGDSAKRALVVVSDGADNASHIKLPEVVKRALAANVMIYAVGISDPNRGDDEENGRGALRRLAVATGGEAFFPDGVPSLPRICGHIGRELRAQYMVTYSPSDGRRDGAWRAIRVTARGPGGRELHVRTRAGYYAPRQ